MRAEAAHHPTRTAADAIQPVDEQTAERQAANAAIECINCAVCYAACDVVASNPNYLGPAALNRAWSLVNDVRDGGREAILEAVSGTGGCHNCHSQQSCQKYCPNELNPTASIAGLKRESAKYAMRSLLSLAGSGKKVKKHDKRAIIYFAARHRADNGTAGHRPYRGDDLCGTKRAKRGRDPIAHARQFFWTVLRLSRWWLFMQRLGCAPYCMNGQG